MLVDIAMSINLDKGASWLKVPSVSNFLSELERASCNGFKKSCNHQLVIATIRALPAWSETTARRPSFKRSKSFPANIHKTI